MLPGDFGLYFKCVKINQVSKRELINNKFKERARDMKKIIFVLAVFLVGGCSNMDSYFKHPETAFKDPHFLEYQKKSEELESLYLRKALDYNEYQERQKQLNEEYEQQVEEREAIILGE